MDYTFLTKQYRWVENLLIWSPKTLKVSKRKRTISIFATEQWRETLFTTRKNSYKPRSLAAIWIVFSCFSSIFISKFEMSQELFFGGILSDLWSQIRGAAFKTTLGNLLLYPDAETIATVTTTLLRDCKLNQLNPEL